MEKIENLENCPNLKILELRSNKITDSSFLKNLHSLTELYLAQNQLTEINGVTDLRKLEILHLRDNKIEFLPNSVNWVCLKILNLRQNALTDLNALTSMTEHGSLSQLESLSFQDCPIIESLTEDQKAHFWTLVNLKRLNKEEKVEEVN